MKKILVLFACLSIIILGAACSTTEMPDVTSQEDAALEINEQEPNNQPTEDATYKELDNANYQILLYTVDDPYDEFYFSTKAILNKYYMNAFHYTIPEDFCERSAELFAENMVFIENNQIKAAIVDQYISGCDVLLSQIKKRYPGILCIVLTTKDIYDIIDYADIVISVDAFNMGKKMVEHSKSIGAKTFVYYTFPSYQKYSNSSLFVLKQYSEAFQEVCSEEGLRFVEIMDYSCLPNDNIDTQLVAYDVSQKINQYKGEVSFFVDYCTLQGPIMATIRDFGGILAQPCHPSLYHGFQLALGLYPYKELGNMSMDDFDPFNFDKQIEEIETTLREWESAGRFATWKVPFSLAATTAAIEYAKKYCEGNISGTDDLEAMRECFQKGMEILNSADTGFELNQHPDYPNCFLFTEDYIVLQGNRE
ncbi:MAG: DUF3798 domain-containing protein [Clostridiales bacterium]|nr:DUF3798 domain-containing protein [Clostridiales bacterium]